MMSMMSDRHRMLLTQLGGGGAIPTFDGSHAVFGDETKGYIECYSSGTLTFPSAMTVDIFAVAGGESGYEGSIASGSATSGKGGGRAKTQTSIGVSVNGTYSVLIGSADAGTSVGDLLTVTGNAGYAGAAVTAFTSTPTSVNGNPGIPGTYPFGDSTFNRLAASGGSGGAVATSEDEVLTATGGSGGAGGGGTGGTAERPNTGGSSVTAATSGIANTGSGGGGGAAAYTGAFNKTGNAGTGGSGIVIVRWGYDAA